MRVKTLTLITGLLGISGVALGAFGAHALKTHLATTGHTGTWETAVLYHLIHTAALFALISSYKNNIHATSQRLSNATAWCWISGITLFSGSLYFLSLGGPRWLGPITPLGGLALILGWGCVLAQGLKSSKVSENP